MKKIVVLCLWISLLLNVNCLGVDSDTTSVNAVVTSNNNFAFDLYGKLKDDSKGNLFFSPYSISTALAIVYGGAGGNTKKQMTATLHLTLPNEQLYPAFGALQKQLIASEKSPNCQLLVANALLLQKGYLFKQDYLDLTASFNADRNQLAFVTETEKSRQTINGWIEKQTENHIRDMIPPNGITEETRLVITNAVYFIGEWKNKFDIAETKDTDFYISEQTTVVARMMHIAESFRYYEDKTLQAVELPYKDKQLSIVVILPVQKEGIKEIEKTLTAKSLSDLISKMTEKDVDVYLPRFKIAGRTISLNKTLSFLGMSDAFEPGKADFSGINGDKSLFISDVFHKSFVEVNEEGTEATTSAAVILSQTAYPTLFVFHADHPFLFMIRDNRSGSILFMGRLMNPAAGE